MSNRLRLVLAIQVFWLAVLVTGSSVWAAAPTEATSLAVATTLRISIPAAGFTPYRDGYDYENHGRFLIHKVGPEGWYTTPLRLPNGATVTKLIFYWYDTSVTQQARATLQRTEFGLGNEQDMASAESPVSGGPGYGSSFDDSVTYATVDNAKYGYWVVWDLPPTTTVRGCGVVIEYTPPTSLDMVFSLSAAAFDPSQDGFDYENHGRFLKHLHSVGGGTDNGSYYAPYRLPQGATITKITFYWYDGSATKQARAFLQRTEFGQGNYQDMAYAESPLSGAPGNGSSFDDTISYAVIDNAKYGYWLAWELPADTNVSAAGVVIEYTPALVGSGLASGPAAGLHEHQDGYDYEQHGRFLIHRGGPEGWYLGAVRLPDGVELKSVTFHWYDQSTSHKVVGRLQHTEYGQGNYADMAYGESPLAGAPAHGSSTDTTVTNAKIDNSKYGYWVVFDLPEMADVRATGLVMDYTERVYLPLLMRRFY